MTVHCKSFNSDNSGEFVLLSPCFTKIQHQINFGGLLLLFFFITGSNVEMIKCCYRYICIYILYIFSI